MRKLIPLTLLISLAGVSLPAMADIASPRIEVVPAKKKKTKPKPQVVAPTPAEADGETSGGETGGGEAGGSETGGSETGTDDAQPGETDAPAKVDPPAPAKVDPPTPAKAEPPAKAEQSGSCSVGAEDDAMLGLSALMLLLSGFALRRRRD